MVSANREMPSTASDTLVSPLQLPGCPSPRLRRRPPPPHFFLLLGRRLSIAGSSYCVGALRPWKPSPLIDGFKDYAFTSASRNRRFPPIQARELPLLECTVSVLTDYESAIHYLDREVGQRQAIDSLMRKAGYNGFITESLRKRVRVTRYQSTIHALQ